MRLTAHAGFGGRLYGLAVQPTLHLLRHGAMGVLLGGTLWSSSPFLLVCVVCRCSGPPALPSAPVCLSHQIGPLCPAAVPS